MTEIIELTEEQSEELNEALEEFDAEHITYRMEGSICLGMQKDGELITELERRAKEMGINLIRVDTFDWQGKDFYLTMGYELAGQYACDEDGYSEYFFLKRI